MTSLPGLSLCGPPRARPVSLVISQPPRPPSVPRDVSPAPREVMAGLAQSVTSEGWAPVLAGPPWDVPYPSVTCKVGTLGMALSPPQGSSRSCPARAERLPRAGQSFAALGSHGCVLSPQNPWKKVWVS